MFNTTIRATVGEMIQLKGSARKSRVDPTGFINRRITADGTLDDMVKQIMLDRMDLVLDIDFSRKYPARIQVMLHGKNLGDMEGLFSIVTNLNYDFKRELRWLH